MGSADGARVVVLGAGGAVGRVAAQASPNGTEPLRLL